MIHSAPESSGRSCSFIPRRLAADLAAVLFSTCTVLSRHVVFSGNIKGKLSENFMTGLTPADLALFCGVAVLAALVFHLLGSLSDRMVHRCEEKAVPSRKAVPGFGAAAALLLVLAWLPYVLSLYPGNLLDDSMSSIAQMLEHGHPVSNHHPMCFTLLVGVFLKIGNLLFHDNNAGVFLFTLFQTGCLIFCIVLELCLLRRRGLPMPILLLSLLFFMFTPIFPSYAVTMWKDILYSCSLLILSFLLLRIAEDRCGKLTFLLLFFFSMCSMTTRNNGLYAVLGIAFFSLFLLRRHRRMIIAACLAAALLFSMMMSCMTRLWNIQEDFGESVGIPLQQIACAMNENADFSQEDKDYLLRLCREDVWHYAYRPCLADTLKWNPYFDYEFLSETKGQFFAVWLRGLLRNPLSYLRSYLLATYGFWSPTATHDYGYMYYEIYANNFGIEGTDLLQKFTGISIQAQLKNFMIYIGSGTLLWITVLGAMLCLRRCGRNGLVPYLPAMCNLATVFIATPVAFSLRYVYIFALGLPFFLFLPFTKSESEKSSKKM